MPQPFGTATHDMMPQLDGRAPDPFNASSIFLEGRTEWRNYRIVDLTKAEGKIAGDVANHVKIVPENDREKEAIKCAKRRPLPDGSVFHYRNNAQTEIDRFNEILAGLSDSKR